MKKEKTKVNNIFKTVIAQKGLTNNEVYSVGNANIKLNIVLFNDLINNIYDLGFSDSKANRDKRHELSSSEAEGRALRNFNKLAKEMAETNPMKRH